MEQRELEELYHWKKQQMKLLVEILDLTGQLNQAVIRKDQVSVNMLLSMRQDPITKARELEDRLEAYLLTLPEETAIRMNELLAGTAAETPEEEPLAGQVAQNRRLLKKIRVMDEKTSFQMGGSRSIYRMLKR